MTPAARVQSAIEILDVILDGRPTEQALIRWARGNRYAGSKDRAAIRDHVYDAIRCRRSYAAIGGECSGRGLMIGALRMAGADIPALFSGAKYAPEALSADEQARSIPETDLPPAVRADLPDWIWQRFQDSLGDEAQKTAQVLRKRANVFLRVNSRKARAEDAIAALAKDGIGAKNHPLSPTALELTSNQRKLAQSSAFQSGLVEIQDAASQALCDFLAVPQTGRILDYCAGGGGKSLAIAAKTNAKITAHDANPGRMADLPNRMKKAGVYVDIKEQIRPKDRFELVLCDVPCSGSGSWRRDPEGKWKLTLEMLAETIATQAQILAHCSKLVATG
ncbi:MAG: RsmB/NOP family class I SAM-dependent RNA methyltransferase, partial [Paracoccaceae bacterium]|nr:RsmB/NOP family class I SAM-dependent RNA methyltransferase [Paracoccaceae bacterium]